MTKHASERLHAHALSALEAADMGLAHATGLELDGPFRPEDITTESLEKLLGGAVAGARLEDAALAEAHDGMTTRNRWRLNWNTAGRAAGLPDQVFVKVTPDAPHLRETLSVLHMAENEVKFYNQIQPELPEMTPRAFYAKSYQGGRFLILMEVLEARGLKPYWQGYDCSLEHARSVVSALAELHAQYWESDRFNSDLVWVRPRTERFGSEWLHRSFGQARRQFLDSPFAADVPKEIRETIRFWDAHDRQVYAYWETLPATLLHGDSHLGNTFSYPDGRAGLFDWQVIYRGHGLREVAYFFLTAADVAMREAHERDIVNLYVDELERRGIAIDRKKAWIDYCLFALDRLDAGIMTTMRGGYGHAASAQQRGRATTFASMLENEVPDLLRRVVRDGRP